MLQPITEEERQRRRENLARGRETAKANRAARKAQADVPLQERPEFRAAVDAAINEQLPKLAAALAGLDKPTPGEPQGDFAKTLALEIAKISGQGTGKKYVDPVELEKREQATKAMHATLARFKREGVLPAYRLIAPTQLPVGNLGPIVIEPLFRGNDRVQRRTEIDWPLVPNLAMDPINESAKEVFDLFRTAIGAELPVVEEPTAGILTWGERDPNLGDIALTSHGSVVRGAAAAALIRNDPAAGRLNAGMPGPLGPREAAMIRNGDDPVRRKVRVLGTLHEPIEVQ